MNQQNITNILLSVIAVLLLIMVLQNQGPRQTQYAQTPPPYPEDTQSYADPHAGHDHAPEDPHAAADFNPSEMVFAALQCPSDDTLPLSAPLCTGDEANARKKTVDAAFAKGLGISKVFDAVIEKYGLKALTLEAQEIIKARKS